MALQLAATAPECVHTLTLIEPPPVHTPSRAGFVAAGEQLIGEYRQHGPATALDRFMTRLAGPDWRDDLERQLPGAVAAAERDAATFFATDLPALPDWRFGAADVGRIGSPVLRVGGSDSGPWFAEVRQLILRWLPQAEDVRVAGAGHLLALTHPAPIAVAVADFLHRHPMAGRGGQLS